MYFNSFISDAILHRYDHQSKTPAPYPAVIAEVVVTYGHKKFLVQTTNCKVSSILNYFFYGKIYAKTTVWSWNSETKQCGEQLASGEANKDSLTLHDNICQTLAVSGQPFFNGLMELA